VPPLGKSKQNLRKSEQFDLRLVLNLGVYVCERERERRGERERGEREREREREREYRRIWTELRTRQ
jgi:hypothetical protein